MEQGWTFIETWSIDPSNRICKRVLYTDESNDYNTEMES
jgi:hypothetical protein